VEKAYYYVNMVILNLNGIGKYIASIVLSELTGVLMVVVATLTLARGIYRSREKNELLVSLRSISFNPSKVKVYAPRNEEWKDAEIVGFTMREDVVKKTRGQVFNNADNLVINIIPKNENNLSGAVVLENVFQVRIKSNCDYINKLKIMKAYSLIPGREEPLYEKYYDVSLSLDKQQEIEFNVSYIFIPGQGESINSNNIKKLYNGYKQKLEEEKPSSGTQKEKDFAEDGTIILDIENNKDLHKVGSIISFYDSAYLVKCFGLRRNYHNTIQMKKVLSIDGENTILSVDVTPDREAKKNFKKFYKNVQ